MEGRTIGMCLVREGCTVRTYFTYSLTHTRVDSVTQLLTPGQVDRYLVNLLLSSREGKKWGRRKGWGEDRTRQIDLPVTVCVSSDTEAAYPASPARNCCLGCGDVTTKLCAPV